MNLPLLRKQVLFSLAGYNISLGDIQSSAYVGTKVISVEPYNGKVHNTKLILEVDTWEIADESQHRQNRIQDRVCFYNRLDLDKIVPQEFEIPIVTLERTLEFFKNQGFDFTEDDIEIVDFVVRAKSTSLGYIGDLSGRDHYYNPRLKDENYDIIVTTEDGISILVKEPTDGN